MSTPRRTRTDIPIDYQDCSDRLPDLWSLVCPCCGQSLTETKILISLDANTLTYGTQHYKMTRTLTIFAHTLVQAWPKVASYYDLGAIHGTLAPEGPRLLTQLQVWACHLRKILRNFDANVVITHNNGYRIILQGQPK